MEDLTGPGTIDQMVADAAARGHQVTIRLIRDWTEAGLLDYPHRRPAGKGHGSRQALYPASQRELFLTLLHHRGGNGISSLARIPVGIWMYWGDEYVPLRQTQRALNTWIGDPRASLRRARETARELTRQLDNPAATPAARRELREALVDLAYTGRADFGRLERAVTEVFDAGFGTLHRAVGHPAAPAVADSVTTLLRARLMAIDLLRTGSVTDEDFHAARHGHHVAYAEYAARQRFFAMHAPAEKPGMYEAVTAENALNACCGHLLTTIGLASLYPEQASQINAMPAQPGHPWRSITLPGHASRPGDRVLCGHCPDEQHAGDEDAHGQRDDHADAGQLDEPDVGHGENSHHVDQRQRQAGAHAAGALQGPTTAVALSYRSRSQDGRNIS